MKAWTQQVFDKLDLNKVRESIRSVKIYEYEYAEIADMVIRAADTFLERDLRHAACLVEHRWDYEGFRGVFDLVLGGPNKLVDWKSMGSVERPHAMDETKLEFQTSAYLGLGSRYLEAHGLPVPAMLEYRALDFNGNVKTATVLASSQQLVDFQFQQFAILDAYGSCYDDVHTPWQRNRPQSCFKFGQECPYLKDCTELTMPVGFTAEQFDAARPRSKSAFKDWQHCPEYYRRTRVLHVEAPKPGPVLTGEAVHAGLASVWQQAFDLQQKGVL